MLKIILSQWEKNKDELRGVLSKTCLDALEYDDLVRLVFEVVYNNNLPCEVRYLDLEHIHRIDDGDYQGTLLFLIPFNTYQPREFEYLMTYVDYGSCSGCDTLQAIQENRNDVESKINDFMTLCKDILTNTIKPYNGGWRKTDLFNHIEEENNNG
jgi:hypothetical protein